MNLVEKIITKIFKKTFKKVYEMGLTDSFNFMNTPLYSPVINDTSTM